MQDVYHLVGRVSHGIPVHEWHAQLGSYSPNGLVSAKDRMIQPALQNANAKQISAKTIRLPAGHVPQLSKPAEVAAAILSAAAIQ